MPYGAIKKLASMRRGRQKRKPEFPFSSKTTPEVVYKSNILNLDRHMDMQLLTDLKFAFRSLGRAKGLAITVVLTLALGIGANAAIFSVVRGVLLRPLANRDQDRLIYIRHTARRVGAAHANFSVPQPQGLQREVKTLSAFGDFSTIEFTMLGLGDPRVVRAGVVGGSYFDVMGLRAVKGRLLGPQDDGKDADGAAVLTYRFWMSAF